MQAADYFDLGELPHGRSDPPPPSGPRERSRPRPWRAILVTGVVGALVAVAAFQAGAERVRDQLRPQLQTPPVLAWLSAAAPSASTQQQIVVHIANLSPGPVRVERVVSRAGDSASTLSANLRAVVTVGPATTGTAVVDLAAECLGHYVDASIAVQVGYRDPVHAGAVKHTVVAVNEDPLVGPAYTTLLNQVCARSVRFGLASRVAGVSVEVPSIDGYAAEVVLTSQVHTPRAVQVVATGVGRFQLLSAPTLPILLRPGAREVLQLRVRVGNCNELALGEEWAQGVRLQMTRVGEDPALAEYPEDPTTIGLFDVIYPILDATQHDTCAAEFS
jgi:hypothetical protein